MSCFLLYICVKLLHLLMNQANSKIKYLFVKIKTHNTNYVNSITKKIKPVGVEIDTTFLPKAITNTQSNEQKLFLIKAKVLKRSIKQLNNCKNTLNYWKVKSS